MTTPTCNSASAATISPVMARTDYPCDAVRRVRYFVRCFPMDPAMAGVAKIARPAVDGED